MSIPSSIVAMETYAANRTWSNLESDMALALDMMEIDDMVCDERSIDEVLPEAMLMEILSRLPDARDLARCAAVNRIFRVSFSNVKSVRFTCRLKNMRRGETGMPFKDIVSQTVGQLNGIENLRLEIEEEMQAKRFKVDELDKNSLWLSEGSFVSRWLPPVSQTLQKLCIIDYGHQAIFKTSPILETLSMICPNLHTLELRNMFVKSDGCETMKKMRNLTLRCVKLTPSGLRDINQFMPNLEVLTLITVVGIKTAEFVSDKLKELCCGMASKVNSVKFIARSLVKLQLKMACPDTLQVNAPNLKILAMSMGQNRSLLFDGVTRLTELMMGASEYSTLAKLSSVNPSLEKVFLDHPCMAFEESGKWKGVLDSVPLSIPDMDEIRKFCPNLSTLSVGPGLWHSFEQCTNKKDAKGTVIVPSWPSLRCLILNVVLIDANTSLAFLTSLIRALPALTNLEVYVHESSQVGAQEFCQRLKRATPLPWPLQLKVDSWKKGLKFGCFSF